MQLATCNHGRRGYGINKGFSRKMGGCNVGGEQLFKVLRAWRDFLSCLQFFMAESPDSGKGALGGGKYLYIVGGAPRVACEKFSKVHEFRKFLHEIEKFLHEFRTKIMPSHNPCVYRGFRRLGGGNGGVRKMFTLRLIEPVRRGGFRVGVWLQFSFCILLTYSYL